MKSFQWGCLILVLANVWSEQAIAAEGWSGRNLGWKVGSDSDYPDKTAGGYYYPSYNHGGERCFGYLPAYIPGRYPGIYAGYGHFRKGASGCDPNAPQKRVKP